MRHRSSTSLDLATHAHVDNRRLLVPVLALRSIHRLAAGWAHTLAHPNCCPRWQLYAYLTHFKRRWVAYYTTRRGDEVDIVGQWGRENANCRSGPSSVLVCSAYCSNFSST